MAFNVVRILGRSLCVSNNNSVNKIIPSCSRLLYTKTSMGLDKYENARLGQQRQMTNLEDSFRTRMQDFVSKEDSVIFSEDLKAMLHIVQKNPEDIDLLMKLLHKYHMQKKQLRFANFTFGPVAMRAFHYLDEPDVALQAYKDPNLDTLFDQLITGQVLLDLLYEHKRYDDVIDAFTFLSNKSLPGISFPRNPGILALAACYKLNTKESFDKALELLKESDDKSVSLPRRAILFIGALALKQNAPHITLEVLSRLRSPNYINNRCQKIMAHAAMGRFTEIMIILRTGSSLDNPSGQKWSYFSDTISQLEEACKNANLAEDAELLQLIQHVKNTGGVQNMTLDEHLTREISNEQEVLRKGQYKISFPQQRMLNLG